MYMMDSKLETLIKVNETRSFTKAAELLSLTQPAVSQHIRQLEQDLGATLFIRGEGPLKLTQEGEIAIKYAKRIQTLYQNLEQSLGDLKRHITRLSVGITHTAESNIMVEVLARYSSLNAGCRITIISDTINNLYDMLDNYEIDLAVVDGTPTGHSLCSLMLATDYLVCVMSIRHPLAKRAMVTLSELKQERMILRLPTSDTRMLFESTLKSIGDSIDNFNITLEVDNIATIKDLVRKGLGVSILPQSACAREQKKGKMAVLPIENLSMMRETKIVYKKDFTHMDILQEITRVYHETARSYQ